MSELKKFEKEQIARLDEKIDEVRLLIKATKEGRLVDFARLRPDEYKKTIRNLTKGSVGKGKINALKR